MVKKLFKEVNSFFYKITDKNYISEKHSTIILVSIILLILSIRVYMFDIPLPDRTSWKEIDYITISQNYISNRFNFIQPTITWPAEPPRVTAMEFPLVPYIAGLLYKLFGFNTFSIRIIPLITFILIIWVLFKLVKREVGTIPALFAATMAGFIPLTSEFGNILFSYPVAILSGMTSIYFFSQWHDNSKLYKGVISCCLFSLTLLLMPTELTILVPLGWLFLRKNGRNTNSWRKMGIFILASLILPFIWYVYIYFLSKSSIDVFGVFGGHNKYQTLQMLTTKGWYTVMLSRIIVLLSGKLGFLIGFIGLCVILFLQKGRLFLFYGFSFAAFVIIVAEGNIDAPYRQFCGIPVLSALFGIGLTYIIAFILSVISNLNKWSFKSIKVVVVALIITCSYIIIINYHFFFDRNKYNPVSMTAWILSNEIKSNSEPGSTIITAGTYTIHKGGNDLSPVLYYYSNRQGWTLQKGQFSIEYFEVLKKKGATLFAAENITIEKELENVTEVLKDKYRIIFQNDSLGLLLLDLNIQK